MLGTVLGNMKAIQRYRGIIPTFRKLQANPGMYPKKVTNVIRWCSPQSGVGRKREREDSLLSMMPKGLSRE